MTKLLSDAVAKASAMSDQDQNCIATLIIEEIEHERHWASIIEEMKDDLARLADRAWGEYLLREVLRRISKAGWWPDARRKAVETYGQVDPDVRDRDSQIISSVIWRALQKFPHEDVERFLAEEHREHDAESQA